MATPRNETTLLNHEGPWAVPGLQYLWLVGISLLSCGANFLNRWQRGDPPPRPLLSFLLDLVYSLLAGFTSYFVAQAMHMDEMSATAMICVGSHMGARLMFALHNLARLKLSAQPPTQEPR